MHLLCFPLTRWVGTATGTHTYTWLPSPSLLKIKVQRAHLHCMALLCMQLHVHDTGEIFAGFNFHGWSIFIFFAGLIFADSSTHAHIMYCAIELFCGFNFHGLTIIRENCENWTPQKFPTIQYTCNYTTNWRVGMAIQKGSRNNKVHVSSLLLFKIPKWKAVAI